jgi:hypothetical protein
MFCARLPTPGMLQHEQTKRTTGPRHQNFLRLSSFLYLLQHAERPRSDSSVILAARPRLGLRRGWDDLGKAIRQLVLTLQPGPLARGAIGLTTQLNRYDANVCWLMNTKLSEQATWLAEASILNRRLHASNYVQLCASGSAESEEQNHQSLLDNQRMTTPRTRTADRPSFYAISNQLVSSSTKQLNYWLASWWRERSQRLRGKLVQQLFCFWSFYSPGRFSL